MHIRLKVTEDRSGDHTIGTSFLSTSDVPPETTQYKRHTYQMIYPSQRLYDESRFGPISLFRYVVYKKEDTTKKVDNHGTNA